MCGLYYRGGPRRLPQKGHFFLAQMGDFFTEGVCFDIDTEGGMGERRAGPPSFREGQRRLALRHRDGAKRKARALTSILGYDLGYTTSMGYPGR
jgi:hypothetical protein